MTMLIATRTSQHKALGLTRGNWKNSTWNLFRSSFAPLLLRTLWVDATSTSIFDHNKEVTQGNGWLRLVDF